MGYNLKPCPFCGGQAELDSEQSFREFVSGKISRSVAVYCTHCSAEISVCVPDVPDIKPEQLADMWNHRAEALDKNEQSFKKMRELLLAMDNECRKFGSFTTLDAFKKEIKEVLGA